MINWDDIFRDAHLHSWPTASLAIQNVNPKPSAGSRNIFEDDEKRIMAAAQRHGYSVIHAGKVISFMRKWEGEG